MGPSAFLDGHPANGLEQALLIQPTWFTAVIRHQYLLPVGRFGVWYVLLVPVVGPVVLACVASVVHVPGHAAGVAPLPGPKHCSIMNAVSLTVVSVQVRVARPVAVGELIAGEPTRIGANSGFVTKLIGRIMSCSSWPSKWQW